MSYGLNLTLNLSSNCTLQLKTLPAWDYNYFYMDHSATE